MGPPFAPIHGGDSAIEQSFGMLGGLRCGCVTVVTLIKPLYKRGGRVSSQTTDFPLLVRCGECGTVVGLSLTTCRDCGAGLLTTPDDGCFHCGAGADRLDRVDAVALHLNIGHAVESRVQPDGHGPRAAGV